MNDNPKDDNDLLEDTCHAGTLNRKDSNIFGLYLLDSRSSSTLINDQAIPSYSIAPQLGEGQHFTTM